MDWRVIEITVSRETFQVSKTWKVSSMRSSIGSLRRRPTLRFRADAGEAAQRVRHVARVTGSTPASNKCALSEWSSVNTAFPARMAS